MSDLSPINFVTGTLGAGKSYFAMRYVMQYLVLGKPVMCNFDLVGDWAATIQLLRRPGYERLVRSEKLGRFAFRPDSSVRLREARERQEIRGLAFRYDMQDDLYDYRLPGVGEDRGLIVLDEGALRMNSREWSDRAKREKEQYGTSLRSIQWYVNMRKMGWSLLVLAHSEDMLDNQVRHMGGAIIRCRNLSKLRLPIVKIPLFRKPRFVAIHKWPETKPVHIYAREVYGLNKQIADHYVSMEEFDANPDKVGLRPQTVARPPRAIFPAQPGLTYDHASGAARSERQRASTAPEQDEGSPGSVGDGAPGGAARSGTDG